MGCDGDEDGDGSAIMIDGGGQIMKSVAGWAGLDGF